MISSGHVSADPVAVLFHYARGEMVNWVNGVNGPIHWVAGSHRGVQWLDKVEFPRKQKRYIFSPLFEVKYDTAFAEVVRGCADASLHNDAETWLSEAYINALIELHRMGFAHSYEAWNEGKLVGGGYGIQLGSMISCDSMFHRMSNASKAAYGQALLHLRERGFRIVDTNGVANHMVNYGEEWMPQWQFERQVFECLRETPSIRDGRPCPRLPWEIRTMLPALRAGRVVNRRLRRLWKGAPPASAPPAGEGNADHAAADKTAAAAQVTPPVPPADNPSGPKPPPPPAPPHHEPTTPVS